MQDSLGLLGPVVWPGAGGDQAAVLQLPPLLEGVTERPRRCVYVCVRIVFFLRRRRGAGGIGPRRGMIEGDDCCIVAGGKGG